MATSTAEKLAGHNEDNQFKKSRDAAKEDAAHEWVFGVVGHVGSGISQIAEQLETALRTADIDGNPIDAEIIKARPILEIWAKKNGREPPDFQDHRLVKWYQDIGDEMRKENGDYSAVAREFVLKIRETRAKRTGYTVTGNEPVPPNKEPRAYILDSIRHPEEVRLLRHVYQDAFVLIGVVCEEQVRLQRLQGHLNAGAQSAKELMERDARADLPYGQRTSDAFHMADFFLDNTVSRLIDKGGVDAANPDWNIPEHLTRLVNILTHCEIVRPEMSETAMHHAYSAKLRSACLSRQVGAALVDSAGNVLATGTNEVPKAGGGVYGEAIGNVDGICEDHRCAFRETKFCSNTQEQNEIIFETISAIGDALQLSDTKKSEVSDILRSGRIGDLLEFSRAVHAEMDALLSAGRSSQTISGGRLFVTTFPCHYCARHIVAAGIDEVQYIEPYPKSAALKLHQDSITTIWTGWSPPSNKGNKVLFRPFSGVAPRMYRRAFQKTRDLKNSKTGELEIDEPNWVSPWHLGRSNYTTLEASLLTKNNSSNGD